MGSLVEVSWDWFKALGDGTTRRIMTNGYPQFSLISEKGNQAAALSHNEI